jgi:hypothetical protein
VTAGARYEPPAAPWVPIERRAGSGSYVSVYLSSDIARLPVRDVTRLADNKSDPNLETGTYGLFSTCEPIMRDSIRSRGISEIFFLTTVEDLGRCLVGRYELGWMVEVGDSDIALAASSMRFISPHPVARLEGAARAALDKPLRNFQIVSEEVALQLGRVIDGSRDRTGDYLAEIGRLERLSKHGTGFRYPSWDRVDPFSWEDAGEYLSGLLGADVAGNTSESGIWVCSACGAEIRNVARLKICNVCKKPGTLEPRAGAS